MSRDTRRISGTSALPLDACYQLIRDLAELPLGSEMQGDYPDSAFNEALDEFVSRARNVLSVSRQADFSTDMHNVRDTAAALEEGLRRAHSKACYLPNGGMTALVLEEILRDAGQLRQRVSHVNSLLALDPEREEESETGGVRL